MGDTNNTKAKMLPANIKMCFRILFTSTRPNQVNEVTNLIA